MSIGVLRAVEHLAGSMSRAVPAGTRLWVKSADEAVVWERATDCLEAGGGPVVDGVDGVHVAGAAQAGELDELTPSSE